MSLRFLLPFRILPQALMVAAFTAAVGCSVQQPSPPVQQSQTAPPQAETRIDAPSPVAASTPSSPVASPELMPSPPPTGNVLAKSMADRFESPRRVRESASAAGAVADARAMNYAAASVAGCCIAPPISLPQPQDRDAYAHLDANPVQQAAVVPVSTFSIDVDTASYANVRRFLNEGALPPADAVRVEELVNYFDYDDAPARDREQPFAVHTEIAPTPWNANTKLLRIALRGWEADALRLPPSNLVFLVDVSGSMMPQDRLPLAKSALRLLARQMRHEDRISLVVYASGTGVVLEPTPGDETATIEAALDRLEAGGSTNGAGGIELAYRMARKGWIEGGNNRVLLATDGDFNVGTTSFEALKNLVEERRKSGVALSTLGFGRGNLNDRLMEQLADAGNGSYTYVDSMKEAEKALVAGRAGLLATIAKDVKVQVEFNPAQVGEYRLIGYEDRLLKREDFNNDRVDAGDIGAGHRVTALYEIALKGEGGERMNPLRYGHEPERGAKDGELAWLRLRWKRPEDGLQAQSRLIEAPIRADQIESALATSPAFRLSAAVAAYGQLLRGGQYTGTFTFGDAAKLARSAKGEDAHGYAGEFVQLAELAGSLETRQARRGTAGED